MPHVARHDVVLLHQHVDNLRRQERRQHRPDAHVANAEVQQRQEDGDRLLLEPRETDRQRQGIDVRLQRVGKRRRDDDRAVRVVALAHVEQSRQTGRAERAEVLPVEAVLGAAHRQDQRLRRQRLGERREVGTLVLRAVATADDENAFQFPRRYCLQHLRIQPY